MASSDTTTTPTSTPTSISDGALSLKNPSNKTDSLSTAGIQNGKGKETWNTKQLWSRLGVDTASAATAGALTCPLITIIDR